LDVDCLLGWHLGVRWRSDCFGATQIFFPKKVESFVVNTTRHLRRLVRLPSPNVVAPSVDTGNGITPFADTSNDITPFVDTSNVVNVGEGLGKKSAVPLHLFTCSSSMLFHT